MYTLFKLLLGVLVVVAGLWMVSPRFRRFWKRVVLILKILRFLDGHRGTWFTSADIGIAINRPGEQVLGSLLGYSVGTGRNVTIVRTLDEEVLARATVDVRLVVGIIEEAMKAGNRKAVYSIHLGPLVGCLDVWKFKVLGSAQRPRHASLRKVG